MSTTSSEGSFSTSGFGSGSQSGSGQRSSSATTANRADLPGSGGSTVEVPTSGTAARESSTPAPGTSTAHDSGSPASGETTTELSRGAITNLTAPARPARPAADGGAARAAGAAGAAGAAVGAAGGGATGRTAATPRTAATARTGTAPRKAKGPRRVRLAVARVDPWSVMKMSFLLSVAIGIAGVILTGVLWMILSTMNVFTDIEGVLQSLQTTTAGETFSIKDYVGFGRVVSLSIVIGVIDIILLTAIATVMAFLYNICSALVGGVQLTLTDD